MKKTKTIYIILIIILLVLLLINTKDYFKYKSNIGAKEKNIEELTKKTEDTLDKNKIIENKYETLKNEKKEEIEEFEKWKLKVEEIKKMLY